jgi:hypothetical protein
MECTKRKLTQAEAAKAVVKSFYERVILNNNKRQEIRYYFCKICKSYHLTKKEGINGTIQRT